MCSGCMRVTYNSSFSFQLIDSEQWCSCSLCACSCNISQQKAA